MKRLLALASWQQVLLVMTPLWLIIGLSLIPNSGDRIHAVTINLIPMLPFLIFGWQYYLGTGYLALTQSQSLLFRINGLIPFVFWGLFSIWAMLELPQILFQENWKSPSPDNSWQEIMLADLLGVLCLYSIICLIVNPFLIERKYDKEKVAMKIQNIGDEAQKAPDLEEVRKTFIRPMNLISRVILILIAASFLSVFVVDLTHLL